jgi:hypothetical protein
MSPPTDGAPCTIGQQRGYVSRSASTASVEFNADCRIVSKSQPGRAVSVPYHANPAPALNTPCMIAGLFRGTIDRTSAGASTPPVAEKPAPAKPAARGEAPRSRVAVHKLRPDLQSKPTGVPIATTRIVPPGGAARTTLLSPPELATLVTTAVASSSNSAAAAPQPKASLVMPIGTVAPTNPFVSAWSIAGNVASIGEGMVTFNPWPTDTEAGNVPGWFTIAFDLLSASGLLVDCSITWNAQPPTVVANIYAGQGLKPAQQQFVAEETFAAPAGQQGMHVTLFLSKDAASGGRVDFGVQNPVEGAGWTVHPCQLTPL